MNEEWIRQALNTLSGDEIITKYIEDDMDHQFYIKKDTNINTFNNIISNEDDAKYNNNDNSQSDDCTIEYFSNKTNKKIKIIKYIAAACIFISIASCVMYNFIGNKQNPNTANEPDTSKNSEIIKSSTPNETLKPQENKLDVNDVTSVYVGEDNIKISMQMEKEKLIDLLGEADKQSDELMWEADGYYHQDLIYNAEGLEINMVKNEEKYFIYSIIVTKEQETKTAAGIVIGSTKKDVTDVYKKIIVSEESAEDRIVLGSVYEGIVIILTNDKVTKIYVGYGAE